MPTWHALPQFWRDYERLSPTQRAAFRQAVDALVADLRAGRFRTSLRIHKLADRPQWSMTWAPDGRATFTFGPEQKEGHPHVVWHRSGGHEISG
jgi:hypothetical protein